MKSSFGSVEVFPSDERYRCHSFFAIHIEGRKAAAIRRWSGDFNDASEECRRQIRRRIVRGAMLFRVDPVLRLASVLTKFRPEGERPCSGKLRDWDEFPPQVQDAFLAMAKQELL